MRLGEGNEECFLSFKYNTSLRVLSVGKIITFGDDATPRPSNRLTGLLTTIHSREKFKELKGYIDYYALVPDVEEEEEDNEAKGSSEGGGGVWGGDSDEEEEGGDNQEVREGPQESDEEALPDQVGADTDISEEIEDYEASPDDDGADQVADQDTTSQLVEQEDREWAVLQSYDWHLVEDALVDKERFPGAGPVFTLELISELYDDKVMDLLHAKCLNQLSIAGTLTIDHF